MGSSCHPSRRYSMCLVVSRQLEENTGPISKNLEETSPPPAACSPSGAICSIPRWIQLVSLPVILLFGWIFAGAVRHALFIFLVSGIIAMLLNPLVSTITSLRVPRGIAVFVVYLSIAAAHRSAPWGSRASRPSTRSPPRATRSRRSSRSSRARRSPPPSGAWIASRTGSTRAAWSRVHVKDIGNRLVENIQKQGVDESHAKRAVDIGQQVAAEVVQGVIELLLDSRDLDLPAARRTAHRAQHRPHLPTRRRRGHGWVRRFRKA